MCENNYMHIVKHGPDWAGMREGANRASFIAPTQAAAVQRAKEMLQQERGELFIHRPNGQLRERYSYGNDPANRLG